MKLAELKSVCSDSPYSLVLSTLNAIPELAGTQDTGFAWSVYTGDLVSHDPENELSRWEYSSPSYICIADVMIAEISQCILR